MRRVASVVVAVVGVAGFVVSGPAVAGASSPPDVARVTSMVASARHLQDGEAFTLTAGGRDGGSNDYELTFIADLDGLHLADGVIVCEGVVLGSPSPDTPACEFDDITTTTRTTTHIYGTFVVTAETPRSFDISVCAASFTDPPVPWPYGDNPGGDCKTVTFTVG